MSGRRFALALECFTLFGVLPFVYAVFLATRVPLLAALWLLTLGGLAWLLRNPHFDRRRFCRVPRAGFWIGLSLAVLVPAAAALTGLAWYLQPAYLFYFPRKFPGFWGLVMVLYPLLSVYPQAIVYRAFFFARYAPLFPRPEPMMLASALAFSLCHIVFLNPVAPVLTLVGGLFFAYVYHRTRSVLLSCVPHALLGCYVFTVGLGGYFLGGTLHFTQAPRP